MIADVSNMINSLNSTRSIIRGIPNNTAVPPVAGVPISITQVDKICSDLIDVLSELNGSDVDLSDWLLCKQNLEGNVNAIIGNINNNAQNQPHLISQMGNLCTWMIHAIHYAQQALPPVPSTPDGIKEIQAQARKVRNLLSQSISLKKEVETATQELAQRTSSLQGYRREADEAAEGVNRNAEHISQYKQNIEAAFGDARASLDKINAAVSEVDQVVSAVNEAKLKYEDIAGKLNSQQSSIDAALQKANQIGLAKAFQDQAKRLDGTVKIWGRAQFAALIFVLAAEAVFNTLVVPWNQDSVGTWATRVAVSVPLIWLLWYCGRNYSISVTLREDYEFKFAAAMAFHGYKGEVEPDEDLLNKLLSAAVQNFGANPTDRVSKHMDAGSPIHEVVNKVLDKISLKDVLKRGGD